MAEAEVGDDVWGDDPTVIELEREVAELLDKEAAVYVPSGAMGNLVSVRSQTRPGDEILVHELAHIVVHEQGGAAVLAGVQTRTVAGERGVLDTAVLRTLLRDPDDVHTARQSLVCVENTVGELGGLVYPDERLAELAAFVHDQGWRLHVDGARLWNAAVATGRPPAELVRHADSISVCFSKGLGAPVGSAVVSDAETIAVARRNRKLFGGGMRQAGIIAAGALYALHHHRERLAFDHLNARRLADLLAGRRRLKTDPDAVETNIVLAHAGEGESAPALVAEFAEAGVWCAALSEEVVRFVTHLDVSDEDVDRAVERLAPLLQ
jgi:threonine aldolase